MNLQFLLLFIAAFSASAFKGALGAPFLAFTTSVPWLALAQATLRTERAAFTHYRGKSGKPMREIFENFAPVNGKDPCPGNS